MAKTRTRKGEKGGHLEEETGRGSARATRRMESKSREENGKEWGREEDSNNITLKDLEKDTKGSASIVENNDTRQQSVGDPGGLTRWKQRRTRRK